MVGARFSHSNTSFVNERIKFKFSPCSAIIEKISYTYQLPFLNAVFAFFSAASTSKNKNNNKQENDDKEESKDIKLPPCLEYQGTNHSKGKKKVLSLFLFSYYYQ